MSCKTLFKNTVLRMRFAHIADNHLGYRQYNLPDRENDLYLNFNEIIDRIIEERVDFVVHSGDLFESPKPPIKALLTAMAGFKKLRENGIRVYAIPGNHDMLMAKNALPPQLLFRDLVRVIGRHKNQFYIHKDNKGSGEIFISGIPYYSRHYANSLEEQMKKLSEKAEGYKKRILLLHQGIDKYLPYPGSSELKIGELPGNFDYYAMGHIHKRIVQDYGRGKLAYPGSTEIWKIGEYEDYKNNGKGFYIVDMEGDTPGILQVNLETIRPFVKDSLNVSELESGIEKIRKNIQSFAENQGKPILYLDVTGRSYDISVIHNRISSVFREIVLYLKPSYTIEDERVSIPVSPDSVDIENLIRESLKNEFREFAGSERLLEFAVNLFHNLSSDNAGEAKGVANEFYDEFSKGPTRVK